MKTPLVRFDFNHAWLLGLCLTTLPPSHADAAVVVSGNQVYTENFDSMGSGTGASYPTGWAGFDTDSTPGSASLITSAGSGTSGGIYNFGSASASDRALGSLASGSYFGAFGVSFANSTGNTLTGSNIQIGFTAEQWRSGSSSTANEVWVFEWKIGGDLTDSSGWNTLSTFDISEILTSTTTAAPVDGNATGNFATLSPTQFSSLAGWTDGSLLNIRWRDSNDGGSDGSMAIDNFSFIVTGVAAPTSVVYWDANGVTAGASTTPTGTWGTDNFWNATADGTGTPGSWTPLGDAVFSAGSDATTPVTVTLSGTQSVGSVSFKDGLVTLTSGILSLDDSSPTLNVTAASAQIDSAIAGTSGIAKTGTGTLILGGTNTFSGPVNISEGTLQISADGNLGDAANDIVLNGRLKTTATVVLDAGRNLTGGGTLAPAPATLLTIQGSVAMSALTIADSGSVAFAGSTNDVGALSVTTNTAISGNTLTLTSVTTEPSSGQTTISNALNFGTANTRNVTVADGGSLRLDGDITLSGGGSNRLVKLGGGTLELNGMNTAMNKLAIGQAGTSPIDGGKVILGGSAAIGATQTFLNYGTLEASTSLTGANALAVGLSIGGRDGTAAALGGADMEFTGATALFGAAGTSGDIRLNVNNHTSFTGSFTATPSTAISGLAVGGTGELTLGGNLTAVTTDLKLKDSITVNLNADLGTPTVSATVSTAPKIELATGTTMTIGGDAATQSVQSFTGLSGVTGSNLKFDIGGTSPGASTGGHDQLIFGELNNGSTTFAGSLIFAGTFSVALTNGYNPSEGDVFDLVDWSALLTTPDFTGTTYDLPDISALSLDWQNTIATDGRLTVIAIPEPGRIGLVALALSITLFRRRRRTHQRCGNAVTTRLLQPPLTTRPCAKTPCL